MFTVRNLAKAYREGDRFSWALQDVSFQIHPGEFVAITGPSGSGKSTLLHLLGGLDVPTRGEVVAHETSLATLSRRELARYRSEKISFVFQSFYLIPRYSAAENVRLPLLYRERAGTPAIQALLAQVGLSDKTNQKAANLSGGEQQRVAIARALVNNPAAILADEPTGNLDSQTGSGILSLLDSFHREGKTLIVVTHDPDIAHRAARILRLKDGRLV